MFRQYYSTDVVLESESYFHFVFLPIKHIHSKYRHFLEAKEMHDWENGLPPIDFGAAEGMVFSDFELQKQFGILPLVVSLLQLKDARHGIEIIKGVKSGDTINPLLQDTSRRKVMESLCQEPLIPYENSPFEKVSLEYIVKYGGTTGIGATLGYMVDYGAASPFALILVPMGIFLCGGAASAAEAMFDESKGMQVPPIRQKIRKILNGR